MNMEAENWIEVCGLDDIPPRGSRIIKTPGGCIALFRTFDDEVFAIDDKCPHAGGPLSQGIVHGRSVTCPLHNLVISLETGEADGPDGGAVQTLPTRLKNGRVQMAMLSPAEA